MKRLEYVYFHIYDFYQQRNQGLTSLPARMQAMYTASISTGGWVLLLQALFLRLIRHAWFTSPSAAMTFAVSVYLCTALLYYRLFILRCYDEKIYNKYEAERANQPRGALYAVAAIVAPYVLLLLMKLLFRAEHY